MEVVKNKTEGNNVEFEVKVEAEKVNKVLEEAYRKVVKKLDVPGFRKGKVPRKILEMRYGKEILHKEAIDILASPVYAEATKKLEIIPLAKAEMLKHSLAEDEDASFTFKVEVKPELELKEYTQLGVEKEELEVGQEDIEEKLKGLQKDHIYLSNSSKEIVEDEDQVIIDYQGFINGQKRPAISCKEFSFTIGAEDFIPEFEEQLIGKRVGEECEVNFTLSDKFKEDLAGKEAVFKVNIKEIKERIIPELNDDFAQSYTKFDTLAELKKDIKEKLIKAREIEIKNDFIEKIMNKLLELHEINLPEALINSQIAIMLQNLAQRLQQQNTNIEEYFKSNDYTYEKFVDKNKEQASKYAKINLIVEAIAKKENIKASKEELNERIKNIANQTKQNPLKIKDALEKNNGIEDLKFEIVYSKVVDFLVENN